MSTAVVTFILLTVVCAGAILSPEARFRSVVGILVRLLARLPMVHRYVGLMFFIPVAYVVVEVDIHRLFAFSLRSGLHSAVLRPFGRCTA